MTLYYCLLISFDYQTNQPQWKMPALIMALYLQPNFLNDVTYHIHLTFETNSVWVVVSELAEYAGL